MTQTTQQYSLLEMMDTTTLAKVLIDLQDICFLKAQHLRENWQDAYSARTWDRMAKAVGSAIVKAEDLGL